MVEGLKVEISRGWLARLVFYGRVRLDIRWSLRRDRKVPKIRFVLRGGEVTSITNAKGAAGWVVWGRSGWALGVT